MDTHEETTGQPATFTTGVTLPAATEDRDRLTVAFRFFLALPHLILVGGPVAAFSSIVWSDNDGWSWGWGTSGLLGVVACFAAIIAWFAILFTGTHPEGLWKLKAYYLRWRVRAIAYMTLLRDEYPPFGDGVYPAELVLAQPTGERNRLTVAFRFLLAIPHFILLGLLGFVWAITTAIAWVIILLTGR
ncbi:MAG TPA: DUF4389 domain-containing protein, partial [Longimicrobiales bacterium]